LADLTEVKAQARREAYERRKAAHAAGGTPGYLSEVLAGYRGVPLAGYMAMRSEIDPTAAMEEAAAHGPVGVPVIIGAGQALRFREWSPGCALVPGTFGALIPAEGSWMVPELVIVPLVAFDRAGGRLGYGGGFYDRTLAALRARRPTLAIGYAYAAQEATSLPLEPTDQPLDLIVTETGVSPPTPA